MAQVFRWVIFSLHAAASLILAFGVWFRCDPDKWTSRMYVDTYAVQTGSYGLWLDDANETLVQQCAKKHNLDCFDQDLTLYERAPGNLGWHLFALLGHFEWISAAFAFFYIEGPWCSYSWVVSIAISGVGTFLFMPFRGTVFLNEIIFLLLNWIICVGIFYVYRKLPCDSHLNLGQPSRDRFSLVVPPFLRGEGNLQADNKRDAELPALRYIEYCITAAELWVAVLSVFVRDAPAFMTLGGYALILLTNLYGVLLHYSLVSDNLAKTLPELKSCVPMQLNMQKNKGFKVPSNWLGPEYQDGNAQSEASMNDALSDATLYWLQRRVWGSFIASNLSTLLNSWLAYLVSILLIFYQQTFLFSPEPPVFVRFAGWSLLVSYSSFGIWVTFIYWFPERTQKLCWCSKITETLQLTVYGLDILSVSAKLSIVGSLSYGFIFQEKTCT